MGIRRLIWLVLVLVLLLIGIAFPQGIVEPGGYPVNYGLTGQVVDSSGNGMSKVNVWIFGNEGRALNTTTNATGYYGFDVPSGNYTITAELPGYSFTSSTALVLTGTISVAQRITGYPAGIGYPAGTAPAAFYQNGTAYAGGTGWVQGRIADQSGAGIPYASIIADGLQTSELTDEQGNYRLALSPGMHRIEAMKSGYGVPPRVVFVTSGQTTSFNLIGVRTIALGSGRQNP